MNVNHVFAALASLPRRQIIAFLGQTALPGSSTVIAANCQKATLAGRSLPIAVTLLEGGNLKTPQPDYRDVLTITIAPQVTLPTAVVCGV